MEDNKYYLQVPHGGREGVIRQGALLVEELAGATILRGTEQAVVEALPQLLKAAMKFSTFFI